MLENCSIVQKKDEPPPFVSTKVEKCETRGMDYLAKRILLEKVEHIFLRKEQSKIYMEIYNDIEFQGRLLQSKH